MFDTVRADATDVEGLMARLRADLNLSPDGSDTEGTRSDSGL